MNNKRFKTISLLALLLLICTAQFSARKPSQRKNFKDYCEKMEVDWDLSEDQVFVFLTYRSCPGCDLETYFDQFDKEKKITTFAIYKDRRENVPSKLKSVVERPNVKVDHTNSLAKHNLRISNDAIMVVKDGKAELITYTPQTRDKIYAELGISSTE